VRHTLYFTAEWCAPCKKTRPIVEELASNGINVNFIDVDIEKELAIKFGIQSVPTFILIEDEKEIKRMSGSKTKDQLEEFFNG
jgi:thioredoxin 1